jgi:hypothetical protein
MANVNGVVDPSVYQQQINSVNRQYGQQSAMNAFGRFVSQQRGKRTIADYTQNFKRQTPSWTAAWGRRGMTGGGVRSGTYQNALRNWVGDYSQNLNRAYADQQYDLNQFDLNQANLQVNKQAALTDIQVNKAREIANAARYLNALKGQFG